MKWNSKQYRKKTVAQNVSEQKFLKSILIFQQILDGSKNVKNVSFTLNFTSSGEKKEI